METAGKISRSRTYTSIHGESGLEYRWHGSHTVNIYQDGQEVDVFTSGAEHPTFEDIRDSVERREACLDGEHDVARDDGSCDWCGEQV